MKSFIVMGILLLSVAVTASAQTYHVDWYVIGSGGGHSQTANCQLDGTIGQPIIGHAASTSYQLDAGFWVGATAGSPCEYLIGDFNGDDIRGGGDVTYGVRFFKLIGPPPRDSCWMDSTSKWFYVAGDVNGNCEVRGSDISRLVAYFKLQAHLSCCHFFPTMLPPLLKEQKPIQISQD